MNTDHYKKLLEAEKTILEKELATVGRKNPSNPSDWEATEPDNDRDRADETEVADGIADLENNTAIVGDLEPRLEEVTSALLKIKDGTFGICEVCGETIEEDRLEVNPAAKTCKVHMNS